MHRWLRVFGLAVVLTLILLPFILFTVGCTLDTQPPITFRVYYFDPCYLDMEPPVFYDPLYGIGPYTTPRKGGYCE